MFITKLIGDKLRFRRYRARVSRMRSDYQTAIGGLERYLMVFGPTGHTDTLQEMLNDLSDLFEQSAATDTPVRAIVGDDPVEFAEEFLRSYPGGSWIVREQERLTRAIARAEGEAS